MPRSPLVIFGEIQEVASIIEIFGQIYYELRVEFQRQRSGSEKSNKILSHAILQIKEIPN